jgi:hypothetical protein
MPLNLSVNFPCANARPATPSRTGCCRAAAHAAHHCSCDRHPRHWPITVCHSPAGLGEWCLDLLVMQYPFFANLCPLQNCSPYPPALVLVHSGLQLAQRRATLLYVYQDTDYESKVRTPLQYQASLQCAPHQAGAGLACCIQKLRLASVHRCCYCWTSQLPRSRWTTQ